MLERIEKLQALTVGILVVLTILVCTKMISTSFSGNVISVTGSAYEIVKSDSGTLSFDIVSKNRQNKKLTQQSQQQYKIVEKYLQDKQIKKLKRKL